MRKSLCTKINLKITIVLLMLFGFKAIAQNQNDSDKTVIPYDLKWSDRMALTILNRYPQAWLLDGNEKPKWDYKMGFVLSGFEKLYQKTNDKK